MAGRALQRDGLADGRFDLHPGRNGYSAREQGRDRSEAEQGEGHAFRMLRADETIPHVPIKTL